MDDELQVDVTGVEALGCIQLTTGAMLHDYARDLLTDEKEVRVFEKHLANCDVCQEELPRWSKFYEIFGGCYEKETEQPTEGVRANAAGNTAK